MRETGVGKLEDIFTSIDCHAPHIGGVRNDSMKGS